MSQRKSLAMLFVMALVVSISMVAVVRGQGGGTMSMTIVERATTDATTDTGAAGDSVGDILTFANEVFDAKNETKVGTDNGFCVRTQAPGAYECVWTTTLADGQITVEGPFMDSGDSIFAVTGGTGKYMNASGQMTLKWRDEKGSEYDFIFEINPGE